LASTTLLINWQFGMQLEIAHIAQIAAFLSHHAKFGIAALTSLEPVPNGAVKFLHQDVVFIK
jgi:hypothetical protein